MNRRILEFLQFQVHTVLAFLHRHKDMADGDAYMELTEAAACLGEAAYHLKEALKSTGEDHD